MSGAEPFACMPIAEDLTPWEASVVTLADDAVMLTYSLREVRYLQGVVSRDRCRTWEEPFFLRSVSGERIVGWRSSPLRLASGKLGIFYSTLPKQPGRDGRLGFRVSADEGQTWSEETLVDSHFAVLRNGCARVLGDGRLLCPAYRWVTHHLEDAEQDGTQLSYSFAYFSDDEGATWQRSANELMIRHNDVEYDLVDGKGFRLVEEEPAGPVRVPAVREVRRAGGGGAARGPADQPGPLPAGHAVHELLRGRRRELVEAAAERPGRRRRAADHRAPARFGRPAGDLEPGVARRDRLRPGAAPAVQRGVLG